MVMTDDGNGYIDDVHDINAITVSGDPFDDRYHGTHVPAPFTPKETTALELQELTGSVT